MPDDRRLINAYTLIYPAKIKGGDCNLYSDLLGGLPEKREYVRKGEKGTMIVFYDTVERPHQEKAGKTKKIPFIKASYVFNRAQLQSYDLYQ